MASISFTVMMRFCLLLSALVVGSNGDYTQNIYPPSDAAESALLAAGDIKGYAALHGMNLTYYYVTTPDGWVLELFRVQSPNITNPQLSSPVLISHGVTGSAFDYLLFFRNQSTAFIFADNGFDVWLANYRANRYSNSKLKNGSVDDPEPTDYYRTGWQHMADFDFPSIIDKILSVTGQAKIYLIGHSMGATITFAALSAIHNYDDKIAHFAGIVPVLKFGQDTSLNFKLAMTFLIPGLPAYPEPMFKLLYGRQILGSSESSSLTSILQRVNSFTCPILPFTCDLVTNFIISRYLISGEPNPHVNRTRRNVIGPWAPGGFTFMTAYNFGFEWEKEPWTKIDFDNLNKQTNFTNQGEYGTDKPPAYDFGALKVPFSLYFVDNDVFTGKATREKVIRMLNATDVTLIKGLNHFDAIIGFDARCYTIDPIIAKFSALESARDEAHKNYRLKVRDFVNKLPFENGCP